MGEVGAGINITPNLSRLLNRWGVLQTAKDESVALNGASVLGEPSLAMFWGSELKLTSRNC